jgi:hypothetical protein
MSKDYIVLKSKAIELRKKGLSYNEIKKQVKVSKSTLSLWLKSIPLKDKYRKRLYTKQIEVLSRGPMSQKQRRIREVQKIIQDAEKEIELPLSFETYRLAGAFLYWAEGSKGKMFQLTNSDPYLILFFVRWIKSIFNMSPSKLKIRLNIYPQQNEKEIKNFWSDLTNIPIKNFGKSYIKPISSGYKKNNLYYGTARIEVPKSVNIRYRVFGWVKATLKDIERNVEITQRKWQSIREISRPANLKNNPP